MIIDHLLICPCDPSINNQYWDVFDCIIPFKQDQVMCSKPRKCKNNILNFQNMNGLLKHLQERKYYHHNIVFQYLTFYLRLKDKQSFLSNQLEDVAKHNKKCYYSKMVTLQNNNVNNVTTYNMKYLLNTSNHHYEMVRYITSMFIVIETKQD